MKKLSKKFKVILIIIMVLGIFFICGKCQAAKASEYIEPATFEIKEPVL